MRFFKFLPFSIALVILSACQNSQKVVEDTPLSTEQSATESIITGAERLEIYLPLLEGKSVAVVANATSIIGDQHLVDTLLEKDIRVQKVFAPEHGFRGQKDAGETVNDEIDVQTGLPIHSLYGSNKKPSSELLSGLDVVVFDIQDVGVRFYTYLSTLHYVMEAVR